MPKEARPLPRNISLLFAATAASQLLFWMGIWIPFYLRFTDFAGIGLVETVMITTHLLGEIPTGAVADLYGKRMSLLAAFAIEGIGLILMGLAPSFGWLLPAVFIASLGGTLYSGAFEAITFDTLLSAKQEDRFENVMATISSIRMATIALASVLGGLLFTINPSLPFILAGVGKLIAAAISWQLVEPPLDSIKMSVRLYLSQTKNGIKELFATRRIALLSAGLIVLSSIIHINGHFLIDAQVVARGWDTKTLGAIAAGMFLLTAAMAQIVAPLTNKIGRLLANLVSIVLIIITMLAVPWTGAILGTLLVVSRNGFLEIFGISTQALLNENVTSKNRATALSAYSMLSSIPYVLSAYLLGLWADQVSVDSVGVYLGIVLLSATVVWLAVNYPHRGLKRVQP